MLSSWHLHEKSREACKVTSSLACVHGKVTTHTTVKWPILQSQSLELVTIVIVINVVIGGFSGEDLK